MAQGRDKHNRHGHQKPESSALPEVVLRAKVVSSNEVEFCAVGSGESPERGDMVVISTRYGRDMARIVGPVRNPGDVDIAGGSFFVSNIFFVFYYSILFD